MRECIAGVVAAAGLLCGLFALTMPWWLAILLAVALYVGLRVSLPVVASPHDKVYAGGATEAERRAILTDGRPLLVSLRALADDIGRLRPAFTPSLQQLCQLTNDLLTSVERKPDSAQFVGMLPMYLDKLVANLNRYVELARHNPNDSLACQNLAVTEEMVQSANTAFERLRRRLSKDDWIALESEAESLKTLFETELP